MTWQPTRLKYLANIIAGQSPTSDCVGDLEDGLPFIQGNAEFGPVSPAPRYECDTAAKRATTGDILISVRAPVGAINMADADIGIGRGVCAIRPTNAVDRDFLRLAVSAAVPALQAGATGSTYDAVSGAAVGNMVILVPGTSAQASTACYVHAETSRIDSLIDRKQRFIDLLQEKRAALITHAVTKGLNPSAEMKDSKVQWIGDIPAHWRLSRLKYVLAPNGIQIGPFGGMLTDYTFDDTGFKLFGQEHVINADFDRGWRCVPEPLFKELRRYQLLAGDFVFTRKGSFGQCARVPDDVALGIGDSDTIRVRIDEQTLDPGYFLLIARHADFVREHADFVKRGAIIPGLNTSTIANLRIPIPPKREQIALLRHVSRETAKIDALAATTRRSVDLLLEYRTALISAAVTGQIDIGN